MQRGFLLLIEGVIWRTFNAMPSPTSGRIARPPILSTRLIISISRFVLRSTCLD